MAKSVGSIAEDIIRREIADIQEGKVAHQPGLPQSAPKDQLDISNVEVPASFMKRILNESVEEDALTEPSNWKKDDLIVDPQLDPSRNLFGNDRGNTEVANELLQRFQSLLQEAEQLISEMTTVGMLGVNLGGPQKKKKRKGKKKKSSSSRYAFEQVIRERAKEVNPWAVCHSSTGPEKSASFERCVKHIKGKHGIKK